jgi:hypothetical protein
VGKNQTKHTKTIIEINFQIADIAEMLNESLKQVLFGLFGFGTLMV